MYLVRFYIDNNIFYVIPRILITLMTASGRKSMSPSRAKRYVLFALSPLSKNVWFNKDIVKVGSRSKVYLKSLIRDLDLEFVAIIAMSPPPPSPPIKLF